MVPAARAFSIVSLCAAILAFSVIHFSFPAVGFEGAMVFGGLALWVSAIASVVVMLLCAALFFRKGVWLKWPFLCSAAAGIVLLATARFT